MLNSLAAFQVNISQVRDLATLYDYLMANIKVPMSFDDLLRSQIVYAVSAFDKLLHDIVRIGILDSFIGKRPQTPKYLSEKIPIKVFNLMNTATIPPKEFYFEQYIADKLRFNSFQDPDKVAEGLAYIWDEQNKWQKIAAAMTMDEKSARTQLRLIVDRRNFIVHEADIDPATGAKRSISKVDCESAILFLENCGQQLVKLVV